MVLSDSLLLKPLPPNQGGSTAGGNLLWTTLTPELYLGIIWGHVHVFSSCPECSPVCWPTVLHGSWLSLPLANFLTEKLNFWRRAGALVEREVVAWDFLLAACCHDSHCFLTPPGSWLLVSVPASLVSLFSHHLRTSYHLRFSQDLSHVNQSWGNFSSLLWWEIEDRSKLARSQAGRGIIMLPRLL